MWVLAALAAAGAAFSGAEPTGTSGVDEVLTAAFAAVVTLAASRSRRWPVLSLPAAALVLASGITFIPSFASVVASGMGATRRRRSRMWGAAAAALALQTILRGTEIGFHGGSALVAALGVVFPLVSGYRKCRRHERQRIRRIGYVLVGLVAVIGVGYGALVLSVASDVDAATSDARGGLASTRQGETAEARQRFISAARGFDETDSTLNAWWAAPARAVPVLSQHARALGSAAAEGRDLALTARETVEAGDYQEIRYSSGQFDLARIAAVREPLRRTAAAIEGSRRSLDENDSPWLLAPLADGLEELDSELADAQDEADLADQALEVAPALLGAEGPRRYFVAFVTPAELRGSGGFMGSWAEVTAEEGRLHLTRSGPVRELYAGVGPEGVDITGPEDYLVRYGRYLDEVQFIGDFGYSPNFPDSASVVAQAYPQAGGAPVDGVISIDPVALAALLRLTGPITVEGFGQPLDADNAADFLLRDNYGLFPDNDTQNDALAQLVEMTFDKLTTGDLPSPRALSQVLSPVTREGRIRLWSPLAEEQALFERLGADGAFPAPRPDHDFLAVSSQNSGNNKIDVYQSRRIDYDVLLDDEGGLRATARVTVRNDPPLDGSVPDYVVGNTQGDPPGTNRMILSIHTPHLLEGATVDGQPIAIESQVEAGFRVYSARVAVPPGAELVLELELSGTLAAEGGYVLDLAGQPTVTSDALTVTLDTGAGDQSERVGPVDVLGRRRVVIDRSPS